LILPVTPVLDPESLLDTRRNRGISKRTARRLAGTCAMVCVCAALGWGSLGQAQVRFTVNWADDRLSVRAFDAPLSDIVAEVARLTGLKVVGQDKLQGRLTVEFADLSMLDALKTLLTDVNYFVQQEPEVDKGRIGLILRVHSMARADAVSLSANPPLQVPALDALIESEEEDLEDEKDEAADDPEIEEENRQNLQAAQQLVLSGAFGSAATVNALERYMESENTEIRLEALKALSQRPMAVSLNPLLEALADDAIQVRRVAIDALGRASDPQSLLKVGLLLEKDPDISVRRNALRVLALRADPAATLHLQNAANDEDLIVRQAATHMLAEFERRARAQKEKRPPSP
jgi:hypothetical protein